MQLPLDGPSPNAQKVAAAIGKSAMPGDWITDREEKLVRAYWALLRDSSLPPEWKRDDLARLKTELVAYRDELAKDLTEQERRQEQPGLFEYELETYERLARAVGE